jgi:hypothetical protein
MHETRKVLLDLLSNGEIELGALLQQAADLDAGDAMKAVVDLHKRGAIVQRVISLSHNDNRVMVSLKEGM